MNVNQYPKPGELVLCPDGIGISDNIVRRCIYELDDGSRVASPVGDYQVNEASVGVRVWLPKGVLGLDCWLVGRLIRECKITPFDFT